MLNKGVLLLSAREKKFRGRGWDVQVGRASLTGDEDIMYGYTKNNFGSIQPISLDTPSLTALYTWVMYDSVEASDWITYCGLNGITLCREDTSQIIYFPSSTAIGEAVKESFFTSSDVGKTVRVLILE